MRTENEKRVRVCAGIVTYNPGIGRLLDNYSHIAPQVEALLICDNGSANLGDIRQAIPPESASLIELGENKGIAAALNALCGAALAKGFDWLLTLDQDSVCPEGMVKALTRHCADDVAVVGPRIVYDGNEAYSPKTSDGTEETDWVITSGSLTSLRAWQAVGGFEELLFIDRVDTDYGIRANRAGYRVLRDNRVELRHELGNLRCKKLLGRVVYVTNHSPMRIYYQCRNIVYLSAKLRCWSAPAELGKIVLKILLYESDKTKKLKAACKGIAEGKRLKY